MQPARMKNPAELQQSVEKYSVPLIYRYRPGEFGIVRDFPGHAEKWKEIPNASTDAQNVRLRP